MPPSKLDSELASEFAADARESYAELLGALARAARPGLGPAADLLDIARRLRDCWVSAQVLLADPDAAASWSPLAAPSALRLLDTLLTLAAYSGTPAAEVEAAGRLLRKLSAATAGPAAPRPPTVAAVLCPG